MKGESAEDAARGRGEEGGVDRCEVSRRLKRVLYSPGRPKRLTAARSLALTAHPFQNPPRPSGTGRAPGRSGDRSSITAVVITIIPGSADVGRYRRPCWLAASGLEGLFLPPPPEIVHFSIGPSIEATGSRACRALTSPHELHHHITTSLQDRRHHDLPERDARVVALDHERSRRQFVVVERAAGDARRSPRCRGPAGR